MNYSEFQQQYEKDADAEKRAYLRMTAAELVELVRAGRLGQHYQLWPAIARRVPLASAGPLLVAVLRSEAEYLTRYHAAAALLDLLKVDDVRSVDLSAAGRAPRIDAIELLLAQRLAG